MQKVLQRVIGGIVFLIVFSSILYLLLLRSGDKEIVAIISVISLIGAIPVVSGYVVAYFEKEVDHILFSLFNALVAVLNGVLLIGMSFLALALLMEAFREPPLMLAYLYLALGWYTYLETLRVSLILRKEKASRLANSNILDDNFLEEK